jgi:N-acetylmuramoyl-L-alanine amidase
VDDVCDCQPKTPPTRRELLIGAAIAAPAIALAAVLGPGRPAPAAAAVAPVEVMPGLSILPRDAWGADLPPKGPIAREDPKFLLVHHTASPNNYADARALIRTTYQWHTSNDPSKGWPDVAYEFFIGRDGDVWEGRAGALAGPVQASATGGSQGWGQLVCLLGDFTSVQPTAAAQASLVKVLAWLADRYQIDTTPGATVSFVSRGSQRWPAGATVTATTIAPHRDMSYTSCPGDAFAPFVPGLATQVQTQRAAWSGIIKPAVRLGRP